MNRTMIVECGQCHAKLRMDASRIASGSAKVRCVKCDHVFKVSTKGEVEPDAADSFLDAPAPQTAEDPKAVALPKKARTARTRTSPSSRSKTKTPSSKSEAPPPKAPARFSIPVRRTLIENIPRKQRLLRTAVVMSIVILGLILGLTAMGVHPTPRNLKLLFQYGQSEHESGLNVLAYDGRILSLEDGTRMLKVTGTVYNHSKEPVSAPHLKLEVLSTGGEFLVNKVAPCCDSGLAPFGTASFTVEVALPSMPVGRFKVTPDKER